MWVLVRIGARDKDNIITTRLGVFEQRKDAEKKKRYFEERYGWLNAEYHIEYRILKCLRG